MTRGCGVVLPESITICEVGLRDGLQGERPVNLEDKLRLARAALDAGVRVLELGSFMSPRAVPQMADTDELFSRLGHMPGVELRALIANVRGVERAAACGCKKVKLNVSASKKHNLKNLGCAPEQTVAGFTDCVAAARESGIAVSGSISMPFGSPWGEEITPGDVRAIAQAYTRVGVMEISLSDTSGMAAPHQTYELCAALRADFPGVTWWMHMHNTRGLAMASILAAMAAGMDRFDASFAGLGGCPFAPGAAGNVATEDLLYLCERMGVRTGVDTEGALACARMAQELVGHGGDSHALDARQ